MGKEQIIIKPQLKSCVILAVLTGVFSLPLFIIYFIIKDDIVLFTACVMSAVALWSLLLILFLTSKRFRNWYIFDKDGVYSTRKKIGIFYSDIVAAEYVKFYLSKYQSPDKISSTLRIMSKNYLVIDIHFIGKKKLKEIIEFSGIKVEIVERFSF